MFQCVKEHPRLFLALFFVPLLLHLYIWQQSIPSLAVRSFEAWIPYIPLWACLAIEGLIVGSVGGLTSVLVSVALFNISRSWLPADKHPILYGVGWLIPFFNFNLFGYAIANDTAKPRQIDQLLNCGLLPSVIYGSIAGIIGATIVVTVAGRLMSPADKA